MNKPAVAVEGILKEELARLQSAEKSYLKEIGKLPKGSLQMKRIKGIRYAYLVYRKGKEVIRKYMGRLSESDIKQLKEKIQMRQKYEKQLRAVRRNQKRICQMVYGRQRTI